MLLIDIIKKHSFKTLSYHARKVVKETLHKNPKYQQNKFNALEKFIASSSTYYIDYIIFLISVFSLITFFTYSVLGLLNSESFQEINKNINDAWLPTILAAQITIIGLIYPLVISLVSILFQNKSGRSFIFDLYQKFSGFMYAGLSGLILSIIIGFSFIFLTFNNTSENFYKYNLTSHVIVTLWFIYNVFLSIWFFVRTLNILDESKRNHFILKFVCNEVTENELFIRNKRNITPSFYTHNLLVDKEKINLPQNIINYETTNNHRVCVQTDIDKKLVEISFFLLSFAIWLHFLFVKKNKKKTQPDAYLYLNTPQKLFSNKNNQLFEYNFNLNALSKYLIEKSFKYKKVTTYNPEINIFSGFQSFIEPVNIALQNSDEFLFKKSLKELSEYHAQIANLLSFKDSKENIDNWLVVSKDNWGSNDLNDIMQIYHTFRKLSVKKIVDNTQYFYHTLGFNKQVFNKRATILPKEVDSFLLSDYLLWCALLELKDSNTVSQQGVLNHERAIKDFITGWESWIRYVFIPTSDRYNYNFQHLQYTSKLIMEAIHQKDEYAIEWAIDTFIEWKNIVIKSNYYTEESSWQAQILDFSMLKLKPDFLQDISFSKDITNNIILNNAYFDTRILIVCHYLYRTEDMSKSQQFFQNLLHGNNSKDISLTTMQNHYKVSITQLMGFFLRYKRYIVDSKYQFESWQSKLEENFNSLYKSDMISGRIYWHSIDEDLMINQLVHVLISLSNSNWSLKNTWFEAIFSDTFGYSNRESIIKDLEKLINMAQNMTFSPLVNDESFENNKKVFIDSMQKTLVKIKDFQTNLIIDSVIDEGLIEEIQSEINSQIPVNIKKHFPIQLFKDIELLKRDDLIKKNEILSVSDDKSHFIKTNTNKPINICEAYSNTFLERLTHNVFKKIVNSNFTEEQRYESQEELLQNIADFSKRSMNKDLILILNNQSSSLYSLFFENENAKKYLSIDNLSNNIKVGKTETYEYKLEDCPFSILTTTSKFKKLSFHNVLNDEITSVEYEIHPDNKTKINLKHVYNFDITLDEKEPFIKLFIEDVTKNLIYTEVNSESSIQENEIYQYDVRKNIFKKIKHKLLSKLYK